MRYRRNNSAADALLEPRYTMAFNYRLVLKLTCLSENRDEYVTIVEFKDGQIINRN